jgi:hypothetical protein
MSKGSYYYGYSYSRGWLMPIEVYTHPLDLVYLTVLSRFLLWRPSVGPRLGAAAEASTCQTRSSSDSITICEALGVRLGPGRGRSGILIVKVIVAPPRESPVSLAGVPGSTEVASRRPRHN